MTRLIAANAVFYGLLTLAETSSEGNFPEGKVTFKLL